MIRSRLGASARGTPRVPPGSGLGFATKQIEAADFDDPVNADWAVNALAPLAADAVNAAILERLFDDTTEEGVGFTIFIPTGAVSLTLTYWYRAVTDPGGTVAVARTLYRRIDGGAWSNSALANLSMSNDSWVQGVSETINISSSGLNLTQNRFWQFEMTRNTGSGSDTLVGDFALAAFAYLLE